MQLYSFTINLWKLLGGNYCSDNPAYSLVWKLPVPKGLPAKQGHRFVTDHFPTRNHIQERLFQCQQIPLWLALLSTYWAPSECRKIYWTQNFLFRLTPQASDTSMKFGTLIVVINTSTFRYSAKPELRRFPQKPQSSWNSWKFNEIHLLRHSITSVSNTNLFTTCVLFITHHSTLTMRWHGNGKQQKAKTTTTIWN